MAYSLVYSPRCRPFLLAHPPQVVAGLNYKVQATVDGESVIIAAFKPLPHTGAPVEVKSAVVGGEL